MEKIDRVLDLARSRCALLGRLIQRIVDGIKGDIFHCLAADLDRTKRELAHNRLSKRPDAIAAARGNAGAGTDPINWKASRPEAEMTWNGSHAWRRNDRTENGQETYPTL